MKCWKMLDVSTPIVGLHYSLQVSLPDFLNWLVLVGRSNHSISMFDSIDVFIVYAYVYMMCDLRARWPSILLRRLHSMRTSKLMPSHHGNDTKPTNCF